MQVGIRRLYRPREPARVEGKRVSVGVKRTGASKNERNRDVL
jgi:hypothetical protein